MWQGRTDSQRTDQQADPQSQIFLAPRCHQLHAGWIDARQRDPGQEAKRQREFRPLIDNRDGGVERCSEKGAAADEMARRDAVSQI